MKTVLVVEDEAHLAEGLRFNLEEEGYRVEVAADGETALARLSGPGSVCDAVVLDVMLPGMDGFQVVSDLRRRGDYVPVLILTARGRAEDVLRGFESGADDYLCKPFELSILIARLGGLLRRCEWAGRARAGPRAGSGSWQGTEDEVVEFDGRTVDFPCLELHARGETVRLTLMEAELLRHLLRNAGKAVSRKSILQDVWGLHEDTDTRAIDNFMVRLRRYVEDDPAHPRHLLTVRGVGYRLVARSIARRKSSSRV